MTFGILDTVVIVLAIALGVAVVFRRIRLPVILGYLVVGAIVGPHGINWIPDQRDIKDLAEFGVVFLMFTVGLEFSWSRLREMKTSVFVLGGSQVMICVVATTLIGMLFGMTTLSALVIGGIVAMSSTALVIKQLGDQFELMQPHGRNAFAILLFQDLAVIPILILISSLTVTGHFSLTHVLVESVVKGFIAIMIIVAFGYLFLRPIFRLITTTRVVELFTLAVLLVTLAAAWLTHALGLSYALGAFLAGMMLGETEFRHQIEVEIRPFRDVLLGLFFITIGMLVNVTTWHTTWLWIVILLLGLIGAKFVLIVALNRLTRHDLPTSIRTGLVLAQGGEFGVAILTLALSNNVLPADYGQVVLAALIISFALAPILISNNGRIVKRFLPEMAQKIESDVQNQVVEKGRSLTQHIIICGFGRVGQNVAHLLDQQKLSYIGLDLNPDRVRSASEVGDQVTFGDAAHPEILKAAGFDACPCNCDRYR